MIKYAAPKRIRSQPDPIEERRSVKPPKNIHVQLRVKKVCLNLLSLHKDVIPLVFDY